MASWTVEGPYGADWLHGVVRGGGFVRVAPSLRRSTSHTPRLRGDEAGAAWVATAVPGLRTVQIQPAA